MLEDDNPASYLAMLRFLALARNFLDVQERRKWSIAHEDKCGWWLRPRDWLFKTVLEAWQWAVDRDAELTRKENERAKD